MRGFLMLMLGAVALASVALMPAPASAGHHWHGGHAHWHGGHGHWHGGHWGGPRWGWGGWGWGWDGPRYGWCWAPGYGRVPCGWYW